MPASIRRWESALVERVAAGDDSALATIYDQFGALVYGIARRVVGPAGAVEVTQDVFVTVWDHPERFIGDQHSLRTALAGLARRRARELLGAPHTALDGVSATHDGWPDTPVVGTPNIDESALALFAAARLRTALEQLPQLEREAVELAYTDGLTFREAAVRLGTSETTATLRVRSGLDRLARQLRERGPVELA